MPNMKSKLVSTLLGEVDLSKIRNNKLVKVIKNRISANNFLFNYGDGHGHHDNHSDIRGHSEGSAAYICHNDSHSDIGYSERY